MNYLPGSIKTHPEWPANPAIAMRSVFHDDDNTGCTSWLVITPGLGATYRTESFVAGWPDADGLTLAGEVTAQP